MQKASVKAPETRKPPRGARDAFCDVDPSVFVGVTEKLVNTIKY